VAVVGAGPGGLVAAKYALDAGFDPIVFEASDDLGGQWQTSAEHSGIWPGMRTNTSSALTAFSDLPPPAHHPLHPAATQMHDYLRAYAARFALTERIRFRSPVRAVSPGWTVNGEDFDAVVLASGRFRSPNLPPVLASFEGELLHAFDYPGSEHFAGRRTLVCGNGVSGLEIASDLAGVTAVVSSFRKPRYVLSKVVEGVSSDWQWYTEFGARERRHLSRAELGAALTARVLRIAGNPASFGAPRPDPDVLVAGTSLCQDFLAQVLDGLIVCRPGIASVEGRRVVFSDGSTETVDAVVCATGYRLDLPYLDDDLRRRLIRGDELDLYQRTLHPDLPSLGVIGQFLLQGPYWPLLELQARWIMGVFSGVVPSPGQERQRAVMATPRPPLESHHVLGLLLSEELGVSPDPLAWPALAEALLFGPMLPPRYRLSGPGARPDAAELFSAQLAGSKLPAVQPADVAALRRFGMVEIADLIGG
jgi:dimethylaniline monooxygenase (N-oxide forming)